MHACDKQIDGRMDKQMDGQNYDSQDRYLHGKNYWKELTKTKTIEQNVQKTVQQSVKLV